MEPLTKADLLEALSAFATREELLRTFATREGMRHEIREAIESALKPYATREEMLRLFPTRDEMRAEIRSALQPYATREEMREETRAQAEETRRHFDVVGEGLSDQIRIIAEGLAHLTERMDSGFREVKLDLTALDRRVTRLEARKP
jgi:hypothetical protein